MTHRNREIDRLRAFAVSFVLLHHGSLLLPGPNAWQGIVNVWFNGTTGVDLFFVISGYVIAQSFMRRFDGALQGGTEPALGAALEFFGRRFRRLFPASLFWAFVILLGNVALFPMNPWLPLDQAFAKFVANALYLSNFNELNQATAFGYYWSLALEMQFYLLLPVFLACCRSDRMRLIVLLAIVALSPLLAGFEGWWMFRVSGLVLGVALHIGVTALGGRLDPFAQLGRGNGVLTAALLVALLLVTVAIPQVPALAVMVASLLAFVLVYAASFERGYVPSFGADRVLDWIGTRSYSIYLAHIPIMIFNQVAWVLWLGPQGIAVGPAQALPALVTCLIAVGLAAELSYRAIELPFQRQPRQLDAAAQPGPAA